VKTTLELPEELMRAVKIRAVNDGRKLKDVVADLIRRGLSHEPEAAGGARHEVHLPLVECAHVARPEEEMTPDRVAEALLQEEASAVREQS
jgi:hypothetical protein